MSTSYRKAPVSFLLTVAVATVFTLRSFAAPEARTSAEYTDLAQDCTGTLTVSSGQVSINGNPAQTGATVLSGSAVSTSSSGKATIDLGAVGRVELGESTSITLTCVAGLLEIRSNCSKTEVEVRRGSLDVKTPKIETLTAGKEESYVGAFYASSTGGVDVKVECEGRRTGGGLFIGPGLLGLLALIGVGAAIATGIAVGDEEGITPSSPIVP